MITDKEFQKERCKRERLRRSRCGQTQYLKYKDELVSDILNLISLCPNHHALFDRNQLTDIEFERIKERVALAMEYFELNK
mgnify:CR=1 FL=1